MNTLNFRSSSTFSSRNGSRKSCTFSFPLLFILLDLSLHFIFFTNLFFVSLFKRSCKRKRVKTDNWRKILACRKRIFDGMQKRSPMKSYLSSHLCKWRIPHQLVCFSDRTTWCGGEIHLEETRLVMTVSPIMSGGSKSSHNTKELSSYSLYLI